MYLSRIQLNAELRATMRALASPQVLHGMVESSFLCSSEGNPDRTLWRVDYLKDKCYLLVLSTRQPNFQHIVEQLGYPHSEPRWETKNYNSLLDRLEPGQAWRFRLRANPVRSSCKEKAQPSERGKVFAHVTQEQQKLWLLSRAQALGFSINQNTFDVVHAEWKKFRKAKGNNHEITLRVSDFEGKLTISDVELFRKTLLSGIGRARAYGCGLITIAECDGGHIG